jgi:hypothetical protein
MKKHLLTAGFIAFGISASVIFHDIPTILSQFMTDDSFYYLEIARNAAHGNGFTFDGLHQTNGFQPLFLFLLIPIYWFPVDLETALYIEKLLEAVIFAGSGVLLFSLGEKLTKSVLGGWLTMAVLFLPGPQMQPLGTDLFIGMESGLDALFLLSILHYWIDSLKPERSRTFFIRYGILIGALFLARLDNVFIITGIFLWYAFKQITEKRFDPSQLLFAAAVSAAILIVYLTWNQLQFGMWMPISGQVKYWVSNQRTQALLAGGFSDWLVNTCWFLFKKKAVSFLPLCGLFMLPAIFLLDKYVQGRNGDSFLEPKIRSILPVLWITSFIKIFYYAIFQQFPDSTKFWYYVQELIIIGISTGLVGNHFLQNTSPPVQVKLTRICLAIIFAMSWIGILTAKPVYEWEVASYDFVQQIKNRVDPNAILAADDAGVLGYFLPNPVVNLDGLVNDAEYFNYLKSGTVREYILKNNIDYLLNLSEPGPEDVLTRHMRGANLELVYRSDRSVESHNHWVYKLYRVIK